MPMSEHPHLHAVKVASSASSLEEAVSHALQGLTDPQGHLGHLAFQSFRVVEIGGRFSAEGQPTIDVTVEAFGAHKD